MWKGQSFQKMVLRKLDIHIQKSEVGLIPYIIYKNYLGDALVAQLVKCLTLAQIMIPGSWN